MRLDVDLPRFFGPLLLILFTVALPLHAQNLNLRFMSANLTSGNNQRYETPGLDILKGFQPDVVAIQEFNYSNNASADFRVMVDNTFGTNFSFFRESATYHIPNGIISRYPIASSGSWTDPLVPDRGLAWAQISLPGTNDLYVVSVHLYSSGTAADRNTEATLIKNLVQTNFPSGAWVIVAGDFNTSTRAEPAVATFKTFLSDDPVPTDNAGDPDTNAGRNSPYDYALPSFSLTNFLVPVVLPSHTFSNGLVFDSRVYMPLADVSPVVSTDSAATGMQHMAVIKDFVIPTGPAVTSAPSINTQPRNQPVAQGSNVTFSVVASGSQPLTYQWRFQGTNIGTGTSAAYSITNVQFSDAGDYTVFITNSAGSITSAPATLTVGIAPTISAQPLGRTVNPGSNVTFTVTASGTPPLDYLWRLNGVSISSATLSTYTRTNAQVADAGDYSVVVSNAVGSVTSSNATLVVNSTQVTQVIAQWNFNSAPPDASTTTGSLAPSVGSGTAALVGGTTQTFASGSTTDPASSDNSGWNTSSYPATNAANKTAGVRFNVSTAGRQNISIRWDEKASSTGSKYVRLQYSTDGGTTFTDYATTTSVSSSNFEAKTNDLSGITAVNNNPNFVFRIVAEFESTAIASANTWYVAATATAYAATGTLRYDVVTISGATIVTNNPPPAPAVLSSPAYAGNQFQFTVTGTTGSNYIVQVSTNLSDTANWISIRTNAAPFIFSEPNAANFGQRFYRAVTQ
jgi:endonuclease/exonuclease/phosphatase family metal-dependent hydrolase